MFYERALQVGVQFIFDTVTFIDFEKDKFEVVTSYHGIYQSKFVIGAWGKRSGLDKRMDRSFIEKKSGWMAVKAHYNLYDFPNDLVALHNFPGGYGGLSKTENGSVNFCYLASYESFQKEKNIEGFNANVVSKNPYLKQFLNKAEPLFKKPLSIAQISFQSKSPPVFNHIFMCGDSATLIHPLCGNGMAMAIHSAKLASEIILEAFSDDTFARDRIEKKYIVAWNKAFHHRIWWGGSQFQKLLLKPELSNKVMKIVSKSQTLFKLMVKRTHGKPID